MALQGYDYDPYQLHPYHSHAGAVPLPPQDFISTLFVSGLPDDVKPREIHNLFRRRAGFDYCQLKYTGRGNQVVAFVTFLNHQSAVAALHSLNGIKFDPQVGSVLHIELARSNSTRKHKHDPGGYIVIDRRKKKTNDALETSSDDGGESEADGNNTHGCFATICEAGENPSNQKIGEENLEIPTNQEQGDMGAEAAECSTLFIANLGPTCTHDELNQVFSQYPGFNVLKMRRRVGMPVAFADFEGIEEAKRVMNDVQGKLLASSDRGGMLLEYARSKMRKS